MVSHVKSSCPPICSQMSAFLLIVLMAYSGLASANSSSFVNETAAHAALANCIGQHLKPEDYETTAGVWMLLLADTEPPESSLHKALSPMRDDIMSKTAQLMRRMSEDDCRQELIADTPNEPGLRFSVMLEQFLGSGTYSLRMAAARVGGVFVVDLMKRLDSKVAPDLVGSTGGRSADSWVGSKPAPAHP